jgi:PqqD family protein of HPr-rel-A system
MAEPLFAADPPDHLRIVPLDALTAIYHRPSGQTHIVSEPMPEILAALWHGPMTADALLARLCELAEVEADAEALAARLGELEAIGLVSRA